MLMPHGSLPVIINVSDFPFGIVAIFGVSAIARGVYFFRQKGMARRFVETAGWHECSFLGRGAEGAWKGRAVLLQRRRNRDWRMRIDAPFHKNVIIESTLGMQTFLRQHAFTVPELPHMRCFGDAAMVEEIARDAELRQMLLDALPTGGTLTVASDYAEVNGAKDERGLELRWRLLTRLVERYS